MYTRIAFLAYLIITIVTLSSCQKDDKKPESTIDVLLESEWIESSRLLINGQWQEMNSNELSDVVSYRFASATQGTKTVICGKSQTGVPIGHFFGHCQDPDNESEFCNPQPCKSGITAFSWRFDAENKVVELNVSTGEKIVWKIVEISDDLIRANQFLGKVAMPAVLPLKNVDGIELILKRKK